MILIKANKFSRTRKTHINMYQKLKKIKISLTHTKSTLAKIYRSSKEHAKTYKNKTFDAICILEK